LLVSTLIKIFTKGKALIKERMNEIFPLLDNEQLKINVYNQVFDGIFARFQI
jgi:hypothetical protein